MSRGGPRWNFETRCRGVHLHDWVDPDLLPAIEATWGRGDAEDAGRAIRDSLLHLETISARTTRILGYALFDDSDVRAEVARLLVYGHIHTQYIRRVGDARLVSVGVVNGSNDADPRPAYAIVEFGEIRSSPSSDGGSTGRWRSVSPRTQQPASNAGFRATRRARFRFGARWASQSRSGHEPDRPKAPERVRRAFPDTGADRLLRGTSGGVRPAAGESRAVRRRSSCPRRQNSSVTLP